MPTNEDLAREAAEGIYSALKEGIGDWNEYVPSYVCRDIEERILSAITRAIEAKEKEIAELKAENARCYDIFKREAWLEAADKSDLEGPYMPWDGHLKAIEAAREEEREAVRAAVAAAMAYVGYDFRASHGRNCMCLSCDAQIAEEVAAKRADDAIRARSKVGG